MRKNANRSTENSKAIQESMEEITTPSIETNEGFELGTMVQENLISFIKSRSNVGEESDKMLDNPNCVAVAHNSFGDREYNRDAVVAERFPDDDTNVFDYDVVDFSKVKTFKYTSCSGSSVTFKRQGDDFLVEGKHLGSYTASEMMKLLDKGENIPTEAITKDTIVSLSRNKYDKL